MIAGNSRRLASRTHLPETQSYNACIGPPSNDSRWLADVIAISQFCSAESEEPWSKIHITPTIFHMCTIHILLPSLIFPSLQIDHYCKDRFLYVSRDVTVWWMPELRGFDSSLLLDQANCTLMSNIRWDLFELVLGNMNSCKCCRSHIRYLTYLIITEHMMDCLEHLQVTHLLWLVWMVLGIL